MVEVFFGVFFLSFFLVCFLCECESFILPLREEESVTKSVSLRDYSVIDIGVIPTIGANGT